jgi:hypothetical protein
MVCLTPLVVGRWWEGSGKVRKLREEVQYGLSDPLGSGKVVER